MASCKCNEITNLSADIDLFNEIKTNLMLINDKLVGLRNNCYFLSTKELSFYDAVYISDVSERIDKLDDILPEDLETALLAIDNKIIYLGNRKTELEAEDKEYHDEQDRLEEEQKQTEVIVGI